MASGAGPERRHPAFAAAEEKLAAANAATRTTGSAGRDANKSAKRGVNSIAAHSGLPSLRARPTPTLHP
jgi:hypothetical protein